MKNFHFDGSQKDINRFWSRVKKTKPKECWQWTGHKCKWGYGRFKANGKMYLPHRLAYYLERGSFFNELSICHKCDNPACVNPSHLWLGTQKDNMRDCKSKGRLVNKTADYFRNKTQCKYGHLFSDKNTYITKSGTRVCRECQKFWHRKYYHSVLKPLKEQKREQITR